MRAPSGNWTLRMHGMRTRLPILMCTAALALAGCPFLPVVSFEADPLSGPAPLTVTFTNNTNPDALANLDSPTWEWDFGDGETSDEVSPQHTYNNAGTYSVTCKLHTANGLSVYRRIDYISVTP